MLARGVWLIAAMVMSPLIGCVREYHPEYHPVAQYSYVQNIVTVVAPQPPSEARPVLLLPQSPTPRPPEDPPRARASRAARAASAPQEAPAEPVQHAPPSQAFQLAPTFAADDAR